MPIKWCPQQHGRMQRLYSRQSKDNVNSWKKTNYWHCHVCGLAYTEKMLTEIEEMKIRNSKKLRLEKKKYKL
jgi:hypothetical protein